VKIIDLIRYRKAVKAFSGIIIVYYANKAASTIHNYTYKNAIQTLKRKKIKIIGMHYLVQVVVIML